MAYSPVPAAQTTGTSTLAHLQTVFYRKKALDRLQTKFCFRQICTDDMLPRMSGKTVQFFRFTNLGANTTPKSPEGAVGTSTYINSKTVSVTVSQYTNFITVSDLLRDTAIDPILDNAAELLGYQAGLSVDVISRGVIDAESSSTNQALLGTYCRRADFANARHQLQGKDVLPYEDNLFHAIVHPYVSFDVVNDPQSLGLADTWKYTAPEKSRVVGPYEDRGVISVAGGCKIIESTNVLKTAGSPNKWRVYIFGYKGIGAVDLEGRGPNQVSDPSKQRFAINIIRPNGPSLPDPEGVIGGAASYNFVFAVVVLEGPAGIGGTYRYITIDSPSSIVS